MNYTLPNQLSISIDRGAAQPAWMNVSMECDDLSWASSVMTASFRSSLGASVANLTVLSLTQEPCKNESGYLTCPHNITLDGSTLTQVDYQATTCNLYACVQNFYASFQNNILSEKVISTIAVPQYFSSNSSFTDFSMVNYTLIKTPCNFSNNTYTTGNLSAISADEQPNLVPIFENNQQPLYWVPKQCIFALDGYFVKAIQTFIATGLFLGPCMGYDANTTLNVSCGTNWWMTALFNNGTSSLASVSAAIYSVAAAVTNKFRGTANPWYGGDTVVNGTTLQSTVCVSFDWPWLAYSITVAFLTALQLFFVIVLSARNKHHPIWKTSTLPLLFYGSLKFRDWMDRVMDIDELEKRSKSVLAKLRYESDWAGLDNVTETEQSQNHEVSIKNE